MLSKVSILSHVGLLEQVFESSEIDRLHVVVVHTLADGFFAELPAREGSQAANVRSLEVDRWIVSLVVLLNLPHQHGRLWPIHPILPHVVVQED